MLIKTCEHELLGCMDVFGDEKGLWFRFSDVIRCLEISEKTGIFKYKFLDPDLKQTRTFEENGRTLPHKFIHEKAVYEFMLIGESEYCKIFKKWVSEIAFEMGILNRNIADSYLDSMETSDYEYVSTYMKNLKPKTPGEEAVKEAFNRFDSIFQNMTVGYDSKKLIETKKDFDSSIEVKTEDAWANEFWDPKYNPSFKELHQDYSNFATKDELMKDLINDNITRLDYIDKENGIHKKYNKKISDKKKRQELLKAITLNEEYEEKENKELKENKDDEVKYNKVVKKISGDCHVPDFLKNIIK